MKVGGLKKLFYKCIFHNVLEISNEFHFTVSIQSDESLVIELGPHRMRDGC